MTCNPLQFLAIRTDALYLHVCNVGLLRRWPGRKFCTKAQTANELHNVNLFLPALNPWIWHSLYLRFLRGILRSEFLLYRLWIDFVTLELFNDLLVVLRLAAIFRVRCAIAFVPCPHVVHPEYQYTAGSNNHLDGSYACSKLHVCYGCPGKSC